MNPLELMQQANLKSNINELQNQLQTLSATGRGRRRTRQGDV